MVFYEMLSGRRAFEAATDVEAMNAILNEEPPDLPPEIPAPLQRIVGRCLEKEPERRFQSTEDLAFALRALSGESAGINPAPRVSRHRSRIWWITAAAVLILLTAAAVSLRQADLWWNNPLENARFEKLTDFKGVESNAAISADGKFVAFLSDRDGPLDVWVTQIGSGQFRNLTRGQITGLSTEVVANVGFSGDGSQVWFNAFDGNGSRDVWLVPTIGGAPRLFLPRGVHAAWSPNGSKVLFTEAGSGDPLFVADRDGHNPKRIFQDQPGYHVHYPTWSLDDRYIYFVRGVNFTREMDIWRIPAVGGNPERITRQQAWTVFPTFLGRRTLLYSTVAEDGSGPWLYAIDVDRRRPHRISLGVERYTSVSSASDGRRVVATVTNPVARLWRIPILRRPAQESEASTVELPNVRALGPRYGPDYFLYVGSRGGSQGIWKFEKGEAFELWKGHESGQISSPAVSADGQQIAFTMRRQGLGTLYAMSAGGTGVHTLSESLDASGVPCWSPDAKWIAVIADAGEGPRLFKVPVEGGPPVQLTNEPSWNPVWSPDGSLIVYAGPQVRSRVSLKAVRPDGKPVPLPRDSWILPMDERYRFLPGGQGLVVATGDFKTLQFFLLDLETFQERPLSNLKPGFTMRSFDVSPDGKYILFDRIADSSDIVLIEINR